MAINDEGLRPFLVRFCVYLEIILPYLSLEIRYTHSKEFVLDLFLWVYGDLLYGYTNYWDLPELNEFFKTKSPKYLEEAVRKDPRILQDPRIQHILWAAPHPIKNFQSLRHLLLDSPEWDEVFKETIEVKNLYEPFLKAIARGLFPKDKGGRKRKHFSKPHKSRYKQWKDFRAKGMKAVQPRYRGRYEERCNKRFVDLNNFLNDISSDFPYHIDEKTVDRLNHHFVKREPLLKAIFGCLVGLSRGSKKGSKPGSMVKAVDRFLNG